MTAEYLSHTYTTVQHYKFISISILLYNTLLLQFISIELNCIEAVTRPLQRCAFKKEVSGTLRHELLAMRRTEWFYVSYHTHV